MSEELVYRPLADLIDVNPSTNLPASGIASFVGMEDVSESFQLLRTHDRKVGQASGYTRFREGDILFAKITPCMENGKGAVAHNLRNGAGFGSTEFHVLRALESSRSFMSHWMQSRHLRRSAEAHMTGSAGQRRVPPEFFRKFEIVDMSLAEQRRVAEVLDSLDDQIRATEQIIAKLWNVWEGLVDEVLTKSGQGVNRVPIGDLVHITAGEWGVDATEESANVWVLRSTNMLSDGTLKYSTAAPRRVDASKAARKRLQSGDILLEGSGGGPGVPVGRVSLFKEPSDKCFLASNFFKRIRVCSDEISSYFVWMLLDWVYRRPGIWAYQQQTTGIINLNTKDYLKQLVPVPPVAIQRSACDIEQAARGRIDAEVAQLRKLRSIKDGLMDSLLTGRVRLPVEIAA